MDARRGGHADVARNMIADGEPVERIIKYTGLTHKEVEELLVTT